MGDVCILIPSLALSMLRKFTVGAELFVRFVGFEEFVRELRACGRVVSYVRHKPTNDLLAQHVALEVATGEYTLEEDHKIYIVALKFRTPVSGQDVQVKPEDLLVAKLTITWGA